MAYAQPDPWSIRRSRQLYGLNGSDGGAGLGNRFTDARMTFSAGARGMGCPRGGGLGCAGCGGQCRRGGLGLSQVNAGDVDGSFDPLADGDSSFLLGSGGDGSDGSFDPIASGDSSFLLGSDDLSNAGDVSSLFSPSASPGSFIAPITAPAPAVGIPLTVSSGMFAPSATPGAAAGSPAAALQSIVGALTGTKYTAPSPASTTTAGITTTTLEWVGVGAAALLLIALVSSAGGGRRRR